MEGSRKSRKKPAAEDNYGKPLDALDALNDRKALHSREQRRPKCGFREEENAHFQSDSGAGIECR